MTTDELVVTAPRVALLARKGEACERLQAALRDAGADIVLVSDPAQTDVASVRDTGARAILIALEPAVEEALDRFDALLADPQITVIFDEADLAAKREGWDAARWSRHLAAKLNGHQQILPPGTEVEPTSATPDAGAQTWQPHDGSDGADFSFDLLSSEVDSRQSQIQIPVPVTSMFDPVLAEFGELEESEAPQLMEFDGFGAQASPTLPELEGFGEFAEPASTALDSGDESSLPLVEPERSPGAPFALPELLVDAPASAVRDSSNIQNRFRLDLDDLNLRIADMQLENTRLPRSTSLGAVVVLAGIGGPDAVRQLLGELPDAFPRPVLIQQRLEAGHHDKLVRQMQRATTMPVALAVPGLAILGGHVYMLPTGIGLAVGPGGLQFRAAGEAAAGEAIFAQLPAEDSAVVLLSGSDEGAVDAAMSHSLHGALVAGQSPDGCFDAAAATALIARGADSGTPVQLARKLAARWPSDDAGVDTH